MDVPQNGSKSDSLSCGKEEMVILEPVFLKTGCCQLVKEPANQCIETDGPKPKRLALRFSEHQLCVDKNWCLEDIF